MAMPIKYAPRMKPEQRLAWLESIDTMALPETDRQRYWDARRYWRDRVLGKARKRAA